ncbi:MAG: FAD-binding oxidoreductase [Thermoplasmata archaeon]
MVLLPPTTAIAELRRSFAGSIVDDPARLTQWQGDASHLRGVPCAAVRPQGVADVTNIVAWARRYQVPLLPRGGGTSLDGESVPVDGAVVVDMSEWTAPIEIDPVERRARVGPGVINRDLQRAAARWGLFFPPNPGSWGSTTIGGNVGTNASGPRSYRYGPTRAWTCGLTVVLGTGEVVRVGTAARKRSAGPDPVGYLVGSEGTLGIVTEVVVHLAPVPSRRIALIVPVGDEARAADLALRADTARGGPRLAAIEYVDRAAAAALVRSAHRRLAPDGPWVLLEVESTTDREEADLRAVGTILTDSGVREDATVVPEADELWDLRGQSGAVLDEEVGWRVREDVAVPLERLPELFRLVHRVAEAHHVPVWVYGHLGDGHLHPNFGVDPAGADADRLRRALWEGVWALGGTVVAEHGVGLLKREVMLVEHPPAAIAWMDAVKRACDPDGIMNPGKLYPAGRPAAGPSSA